MQSDAKRRQTYLDRHLSKGTGIHTQLIKLAQGTKPDTSEILESLDRLNTRVDCSDFRLAGIVRLLYQFPNHPTISNTVWKQVKQSVLGYKYWPSEPGHDNMCTWTENHYILFASGDYLMGQLYPDEIFTNSGQTGHQKMIAAHLRVERWLDLRFKTGFSEWFSNVYYEETMTALVNLVDFSADEALAQKSAMVLDLMLTDMALNQFHGTFGSTHGRSYFRHKIDGHRENTRGIHHLMFGLNKPKIGSMAAIALALSQNYHMPQVLYDIANDQNRMSFENRQRLSIDINTPKQWDLDPHHLEDGMLFLTYEAMNDPKVMNLFAKMLDEYNWWNNAFWEGFKSSRWLIDGARKIHALPVVAHLFERDINRNIRTEVNTYTYRTPHYMLSSAQDYRKGMGGDQQSFWSATLGTKAICFTTHPVGDTVNTPTPNYWTGSGNLPRVGQIKNVVIALYDISTLPGLYITHKHKFTHAWLPKQEFDEIIERENWIFARKSESYLALWSSQPYHWQTKGEWQNAEVIAPGKQNVWICELGSKQENGSFEHFIQKIGHANIWSRSLRVTYHSPSQGRLDFSWHGDLKQNGQSISLSNYPRYQNPYMSVDYPAHKVEINHNNHWLRLDYQTLTRNVSAFISQKDTP